MQLIYQVFRFNQLIAEGWIETPFQVGRQLPEEAHLHPVCISNQSDIRRLVFASRNVDRAIPRRAFRVSDRAGVPVIENTHETVALGLADGRNILPGEDFIFADNASVIFANGYRVWIGKDAPKVEEDQIEEDLASEFRMLETVAVLESSPISSASLGLLPSIDSKGKAIDLVKAALGAFREPSNTASFYKTVVNSVIEMLDVDRAMVLVRKNNEWLEHASATRNPQTREITCVVTPANSQVDLPPPHSNPHRSQALYSRSLVQRTLKSRRTTIVETNTTTSLADREGSDAVESLGNSMLNIQRAVASPIFDDRQDVIAILYADKRIDGFQIQTIGDLEASLLEVLASGVSNSLMRQREEEFRSSAGQFFSPLMLDRLQSQKDLLQGRDAEVSVLFCDIRSFSKVSHQVGPTIAIAWVNDVLTYLSECVLRYDGVLVDYVGDELMAMFGAPEEQLDHADRACRAAVDMLNLVPQLDADWRVRYMKNSAFTLASIRELLESVTSGRV